MSNADGHLCSIDLFNNRDFDAIGATFASECESVDQARGVTLKGRDGAREAAFEWVSAFSNGMMTDARVIDGGTTTVLLFTGSGTNDGPLGPLPATGRQVSMRFCEIREHDAAGSVVRAELFYDQVTMLVQLGHMPAPEG